ncbi:RFX3 [Cordylochernes scorpioides]|uniref:RFX3 n=1 Tax=Cordylochernes scorpioides TaxID=51811 RepID=A0ABY6KFV1_9ARAC|nr:RFX3 [Cordylochernes scorpioides]
MLSSKFHTLHQPYFHFSMLFCVQIQWLLENYETAEGVSLPRSTLYNHYLRYCSDMKIEPINAASFGKLIRSVFVNIRTRRLGTRGNSKYHYYGIRVKLGSYLADLRDEIKPLTGKNNSSGCFSYLIAPFHLSSFSPTYHVHFTAQWYVICLSDLLGDCRREVPTLIHVCRSICSSDSFYENGYFPCNSSANINSKHLQFLGDSSDAIPIFPNLDHSTVVTPESGITEEDVSSFKMLYKEHCEAFLDSVVSLNFVMVETIWQTFWRTYSSSHILGELEKLLAKEKLYQMCSYQAVLHFMQDTDLQFYQNLVDILIPDVLRPIPTSMTQSIRHFAKHLEGWLTGAMRAAPREAIQAKLSAAGALSQTLRRYTSLNHLAQAGRAVLQNPGQLAQMALDLGKVDFNHVREQASWVCQCDESLLHHLTSQFKDSLREKKSFEQWADWLERVVNLVISPYNTGDIQHAARTFLLRWSFYCSLVIRDLTLRSAASFGSFHLLRLLFDEYMFYLVEHKVAGITGKMPICVMAATAAQ